MSTAVRYSSYMCGLQQKYLLFSLNVVCGYLSGRHKLLIAKGTLHILWRNPWGSTEHGLRKAGLEYERLFLWIVTLCFHYADQIQYVWCRMRRRWKRLPIRSWHSRKQKKWRKWAPCLRPTSQSQRKELQHLWFIFYPNISAGSTCHIIRGNS